MAQRPRLAANGLSLVIGGYIEIFESAQGPRTAHKNPVKNMHVLVVPIFLHRLCPAAQAQDMVEHDGEISGAFAFKAVHIHVEAQWAARESPGQVDLRAACRDKHVVASVVDES